MAEAKKRLFERMRDVELNFSFPDPCRPHSYSLVNLRFIDNKFSRAIVSRLEPGKKIEINWGSAFNGNEIKDLVKTRYQDEKVFLLFERDPSARSYFHTEILRASNRSSILNVRPAKDSNKRFKEKDIDVDIFDRHSMVYLKPETDQESDRVVSTQVKYKQRKIKKNMLNIKK